MELVERRGEEMYFNIEHSRAYREVQSMFLEAVESADPSNIMVWVWTSWFSCSSILNVIVLSKFLYY